MGPLSVGNKTQPVMNKNTAPKKFTTEATQSDYRFLKQEAKNSGRSLLKHVAKILADYVASMKTP